MLHKLSRHARLLASKAPRAQLTQLQRPRFFMPQMRVFSTPFDPTMSIEQANTLYYKQQIFERKPEDMKAALDFFRELNKHEMYLTLVRLFFRHEVHSRVKDDLLLGPQVYEQFEFARDQIEQGRKQGKYEEYEQGSKLTQTQELVQSAAEMLIYVCVFVGFVFMSMKIVQNQEGNKKQPNFEFKKAKDVQQKLSDVKGIDEIRDEIQDLIKMIKNSDEYNKKGAKLHRGVLLSGKPGTGKTLLSRAIAGEAGTNFLYTTGSSFDEMFVGTGAKRVRELFAEARKNKPCIIFIDEIDTLLSASRRYGSEHSSSRGTINAMLTEMDGFDPTDQIVVIGATNHKDSLDPAAVRPGRFDKKIDVPAPDIKGRTDIFEIYLDKITKSDDIQAKKLAEMTPGFTGAEIENLVNTAITEAVHRGKELADLSDFEYARDRIMMGIERKKLSMTEKERLNTSIHESGHAVTCFYTEGANKLYKATIVARGGSLGATFMVPNESDSLSLTKEKVLARIDVAMGGHVAEELFIGDKFVTTGCGSDLDNATKLAYMAVR